MTIQLHSMVSLLALSLSYSFVPLALLFIAAVPVVKNKKRIVSLCKDRKGGLWRRMMRFPWDEEERSFGVVSMPFHLVIMREIFHALHFHRTCSCLVVGFVALVEFAFAVWIQAYAYVMRWNVSIL